MSMDKKFPLNIGDQSTEIEVNGDGIVYTAAGHKTHILFEDVIGLQKSEDEDNFYNLYYIQKQSDNKLTKEVVTFTADNKEFDQLKETITSKIWTVTGRPKKVVIFINSIGGTRKGKQTCEDLVVPVLSLAGIQTDVIASQYPNHATEFAETYDFKNFDGVVIMGGDGTISAICNGLLKSTQINAGIDFNDPDTDIKPLEIPIAIIPTGSGNGLSTVLHGCKDVLTSLLHLVKGNTIEGNVLGNFNGEELVGYSTFCSCYALIHELLQFITSNRWMGLWRNTLGFIWYINIRPYREIDVEITYDYPEQMQSNDQSEVEKTNKKVIQKKKIISLWAFTNSFDYGDNSNEPEVQKDQFDLLDYTMCGRLEMRNHFRNFRQIFKKENRDATKNFLTFSKVKAFHIKVLQDTEKAKNEIDYIWNVDGELRKLNTPDVYVRLFPRCYTIFSSYKGPIRWH